MVPSLWSFPLSLLFQTAGCRFISEDIQGQMKGMETDEHFTERSTESLRTPPITVTQRGATRLQRQQLGPVCTLFHYKHSRDATVLVWICSLWSLTLFVQYFVVLG